MHGIVVHMYLTELPEAYVWSVFFCKLYVGYTLSVLLLQTMPSTLRLQTVCGMYALNDNQGVHQTTQDKSCTIALCTALKLKCETSVCQATAHCNKPHVRNQQRHLLSCYTWQHTELQQASATRRHICHAQCRKVILACVGFADKLKWENSTCQATVHCSSIVSHTQ